MILSISIFQGTHSLADSCAISKLQREVTKLMQQTSLNRDHNVVRDKEMKVIYIKILPYFDIGRFKQLTYRLGRNCPFVKYTPQ